MCTVRFGFRFFAVILVDQFNITNYGNTLCYSNKEWSLSTEYLNIAPSFKAILLYEWVMVPVRPGKKISWFWSSGGSILTQIKKNAGRKLNTTPRKIPSPVFSSPVNHRHPRSSAF